MRWAEHGTTQQQIALCARWMDRRATHLLTRPNAFAGIPASLAAVHGRRMPMRERSRGPGDADRGTPVAGGP